MTGKRFYQLGLIVFFIVFINSRAGAAEREQLNLSLGTASVGGVYYSFGMVIANCANQSLKNSHITITAEVTEGSVENIYLISERKIQLAIISPQIGYFARNGLMKYKNNKVDYRVLVRLLPNGNIWTTLEKSSIMKIADLEGKNVAVGPASGGLSPAAIAELGYFGIRFIPDKKIFDFKPFFLGMAEMAVALKDGTIDGAILTAQMVNMVAATHRVRLLSWNQEDAENYIKKNPYYDIYTYPAGIFKGVNYPVLSIDTGMQLIAPKNLDDRIAYLITKTLAENLPCLVKTYAPAKALTPAWMAAKLGNPYHPGAIKYYKEKGIWK